MRRGPRPTPLPLAVATQKNRRLTGRAGKLELHSAARYDANTVECTVTTNSEDVLMPPPDPRSSENLYPLLVGTERGEFEDVTQGHCRWSQIHRRVRCRSRWSRCPIGHFRK